ncbi:WD40-repeat-containing domain protein [Podospora australis]|uniref:ASTRA-associated protein 1 n=1 Tax=Podospora australis TaxID=1536484 RepID=A0AAN7AKC9_9PEZI|nr:WD40-repeat-containing domain protein [Podospora australis]
MSNDDAASLPAQPKSILRGHKTQVHAAAFVRNNQRLLTGDSDGFIVAWDLTIMRPRAVWQAHTAAILGVAGWGSDRIITHGRDNRLVVWKITVEDEGRMSATLPLDPTPESRPQPWLLHVLEINTMNFCSFSYCPASADVGSTAAASDILVAVPNTLASEAVDIFHLPSRNRLHTVKTAGEKNGMVMALSLFHHYQTTLTLITGYENGLVAVSHLDPTTQTWSLKYQAPNVHSQPLLSLDVSSARDFFLTSGADAIIAKHPLPSPVSSDILTHPLKVVNTKHSGQQSLCIRSDNKIFATAGWDSKIRVYSVKTLKEVAVLKWHQVGCYAVAFADVTPATEASPPPATQDTADSAQQQKEAASSAAAVIHVPKLVEMTVREKRLQHARTAHWLAAGGRDGKVSLWDVF